MGAPTEGVALGYYGLAFQAGDRVRLFLLLLVGLLTLAFPLRAQVILNEIMYHPVEEPAFAPDGRPMLDLTEDVHEFVELFNTTGAAINLGGWQLAGGIAYTFPQGATIGAHGFVVVAKNPERLAAISSYGLARQDLLGPFDGQLGNNNDTIQLRSAAQQIVDAINYSAGFPWPGAADGLGAGARWTRINPLLHQYRGRSLERVSSSHSGQDPANWHASPLETGPTPARPNTVAAAQPDAVVITARLTQAVDGQSIIRSNQAALLSLRFSTSNRLGNVRVEFFADDINRTNEIITSLPMNGAGTEFTAIIPGFTERTVVRYRVWAERQQADAFEQCVYPRWDDPFAWHAYFVTPLRAGPNANYDVYISSNSLSQLSRNMLDNPLTGYKPPLGTLPNGRWNMTEPGFLASAGRVFDVQVRYSGSYFGRSPGANSFTIDFPAYQSFGGVRSIFVLDKPLVNAFGHQLFRDLGFPSADTRAVDLYFNGGPRQLRTEIEEHDQQLLERYRDQPQRLEPDPATEPLGRLFKSSGTSLVNFGPYSPGDGQVLGTNEGWAPLQRYEWIYSSKNKDWEGYVPFGDLLEQLASARAGLPLQTAELRAYLLAHWDVENTLTYLAARNWMGAWDDTWHNYFLWRRGNGRWTLVPWDFDGELANVQGGIFVGENANRFKDSFLKAFRAEFIQRIYWLNHTVFHPDNLAIWYPWYPEVAQFARNRRGFVDQQCDLGPFHRPSRPVPIVPVGSESVQPPFALQASPYQHSLAPVPAHASTVWRIRSADGDYRTPIYSVTSSVALTSLPIPFERLETGQLYYWRCLYQDANGHPSVLSDEAAFRYGGNIRRQTLLTLEADTHWRYHDGGTNLGRTWRDVNYDDSAWREGPPLLGVSSANLDAPVRTPLALGSRTYYFRRKFQFPGQTAGAALRLRHIIDDGAVFYLNGAEVYRYNLSTFFSPGAVPFTLAAVQAIGDPTYAPAVNLSVTNLFQGENILAVEVHQDLTNSADVVFGLTLEGSFAVAAGGVRLNEVMALNRSTLNNGPGFPDWIELHNPTTQAQSLDGLSLTDNPLAPGQYVFPNGLFISPGGWLRVWCDNDTAQPGLHTGFNLRAEGEGLWLFASSPAGLAELDHVQFGVQLPDRSIGRVPDGTGAWQLNRPTPGATNQEQPLGTSQFIRINEWMASPSSGPDWFELFNPELLPVALDGLGVTDDVQGQTRSLFPSLSFLDGYGFLIVIADGDLAAGADHVGFRLSASGEAIALMDAGDRPIDLVTFGLQSVGVSEGRLPDGSLNIGPLFSPTPGRSNAGDADDDGLPNAWEQSHQLNPLWADDARLDSDGDGQNNRDEFLAGTDPMSRADYLQIAAAEWIRPDKIRMTFRAQPGRVYEVQFAASARGDLWETLQVVGPLSSTQTVEVLDELPGVHSRFYRLWLRRVQ